MTVSIRIRVCRPAFFFADNLLAVWATATAGALLLTINIIAWLTHAELNPLISMIPLTVRPWVVGAVFGTVLALFTAMARVFDSPWPLWGLGAYWSVLLTHDLWMVTM